MSRRLFRLKRSLFLGLGQGVKVVAILEEEAKGGVAEEDVLGHSRLKAKNRVIVTQSMMAADWKITIIL